MRRKMNIIDTKQRLRILRRFLIEIKKAVEQGDYSTAIRKLDDYIRDIEKDI